MMFKRIISIVTVLSLVFMLLPTIAFAAPGTAGTFAEFKKLCEDATTEYIGLTGNIVFPLQSITINTAKPSLIIDGNGFTITTSDSASLTYTMRYNRKGNLKLITFNNVNITGPNYYGIITIDDSLTYSDVVVAFNGITYTGPQLAWMRKSNAVIKNSVINIVKSARCPAQEVVECLNVVLDGSVTITKDASTSSNELFWITYSTGGVTIKGGAVVTVNNNIAGAKCGSGFVYYSCEKGSYFKVEDGGQLYYTGVNLFQSGAPLTTLSFGVSSRTEITLNGKLYCDYGAFRTSGKMYVERAARLHIYALNNTNSQPLVQLKGTGECYFNSPGEVLFYNSSVNTCNTGLAMGPHGCDVKYYFNNVRSIEYWTLNKTIPYNAISGPTNLWKNTPTTLFSAFERVVGATVKAATTTDYTGTNPFNTKTALLKNVNIVRINASSIT